VIPTKRHRQNNNASPAVRLTTNNNSIDLNLSQDYTVKKDFTSPVVPRPSRAARAIIDRTLDVLAKPEVAELDITTITETLKSKNIKASSSKFGFIGLGIMGSGIVKNLINSGHDVCVYNRTQDKTEKFEKAGKFK
jgi:3-hydroxyisobutyrate dehydrogenase